MRCRWGRARCTASVRDRSGEDRRAQQDARRVGPSRWHCGGDGFRWTISVDNIVEASDECAAAGYKVAVPVTNPSGRAQLMIEDPDGNWVELLQIESA